MSYPNPFEWPADLLYQAQERSAIKQDSGIPESLADAQGYAETWARREGRPAEQVGLFGGKQ